MFWLSSPTRGVSGRDSRTSTADDPDRIMLRIVPRLADVSARLAAWDASDLVDASPLADASLLVDVPRIEEKIVDSLLLRWLVCSAALPTLSRLPLCATPSNMAVALEPPDSVLVGRTPVPRSEPERGGGCAEEGANRGDASLSLGEPRGVLLSVGHRLPPLPSRPADSVRLMALTSSSPGRWLPRREGGALLVSAAGVVISSGCASSARTQPPAEAGPKIPR